MLVTAIVYDLPGRTNGDKRFADGISLKRFITLLGARMMYYFLFSLAKNILIRLTCNMLSTDK